jgi:hypothetical protein
VRNERSSFLDTPATSPIDGDWFPVERVNGLAGAKKRTRIAKRGPHRMGPSERKRMGPEQAGEREKRAG